MGLLSHKLNFEYEASSNHVAGTLHESEGWLSSYTMNEGTTLFANPNSISLLGNFYYLNDGYKIWGFLRFYPHLISFLVEMHFELARHFPYEDFRLGMHRDDEAGDDCAILVEVWTKRSVEEIDEAKDAFDENWWLDAKLRQYGQVFVEIRFYEL